MKVFKNKYKNIGYLIYRIVSPVVDPLKIASGLYGYSWFVRDLVRFRNIKNGEKIKLIDLYPALHDKSIDTSLDAHYFYQQLWAFENIQKSCAKKHVDVGSTYEMSGYLSKITSAEFVDIRPINTSLSNLKIVNGDVTKLPYKDGEIKSLSCLHVIEHVGLGRYGDKVDPNGSVKGMKELQRVLSENGKLYFSTPVGVPRICFNAHRVFSPSYIVKTFSLLSLVSFSFVNDDGVFIENVDISSAENQNYACGMFIFEKKHGA
ncbi:MAG: DUF268 domain-containing protein [Patescibacteria group bacterium]